MKTLVFAALLFAASALAQQANVTLAWDAPQPATGLAGYRLYSGPATGVYTNHLDTTNLTYTVTNLVLGAKYFFVVTAVSTEGFESDPSNEVNYTVPSRPPAPVNLRGTLNITGTITFEIK